MTSRHFVILQQGYKVNIIKQHDLCDAVCCEEIQYMDKPHSNTKSYTNNH